MAITVEMMQAAARTGLSIVCASCEQYWEARGKGIVGDACLAVGRCGSPLVGDDFHEYRGIMTEHAFSRFCFVCGEPSVNRLRKHGRAREIGVCAAHFDWLRDAVKRNPIPLRLGEEPKKELPPIQEGSLVDAILKTEKKWAEEDGREFDPHEVLADLSAAVTEGTHGEGSTGG